MTYVQKVSNINFFVANSAAISKRVMIETGKKLELTEVLVSCFEVKKNKGELP